MTGVDRRTGRWMSSGWAHVVQSIEVIVTTAIGSRVERRPFGCEGEPLVDRPMTESEVLKAFMAVAVALDRWEPRFRLVRVTIVEGTVLGKLVLRLAGVHYPRGHLGDWSRAEPRDLEVAA